MKILEDNETDNTARVLEVFVLELLWNAVLLTLPSVLWQRCDSVLGRGRDLSGPPWGWRWPPGYLPAAHRQAVRWSPGFRRFALLRSEAQTTNLWRHLTVTLTSFKAGSELTPKHNLFSWCRKVQGRHLFFLLTWFFTWHIKKQVSIIS